MHYSTTTWTGHLSRLRLPHVDPPSHVGGHPRYRPDSHRLSGRLLVLCRRRMYGYDEAKLPSSPGRAKARERLARFATQGSVVIAHGSVKHGGLSCADVEGDGLAEERGCEGRLTQGLSEGGLRGPVAVEQEGDSWTGEHVFFHRHSNWRASRKVAKPVTVLTNSHGRWLDVYFAPPFGSPLCCEGAGSSTVAPTYVRRLTALRKQ